MWQLLAIILVINAAIGWFLFEQAWKASEFHRVVDEDRDRNYPAWRRLDCHLWKRSEMLPLALTILPLRIIFFVLSMGMINFVHFILYLGCDHNLPQPNRRRIGKMVFTIQSFFNALSLGIIINVK